MKFNKISIWLLILLPFSVLTLEEEISEATTTINHRKELSEEEQKALHKKLQNAAKKHYKDGDFFGIRTKNYINKVNEIQDNDIKRYLINLHESHRIQKLAELSKERLENLQQRIKDRIAENDKSLLSSKGLRDDLRTLLDDHVQYFLKVLEEPPTSLQEAYKKLNFIQQKLFDYNQAEMQLKNQKLPVGKQKELQEILQKGKSLQSLAPKLEQKLKTYIDQQPLINRLKYKKEELAKLLENDLSLQTFNNFYPTTEEQMKIIKQKRPDLFKKKQSIPETIQDEIENIQNNILPSLKQQLQQQLEKNLNNTEIQKLQAEIKLLNLKIETYNLEQEWLAEQEKIKKIEEIESLEEQITSLQSEMLINPKTNTVEHANELANLKATLKSLSPNTKSIPITNNVIQPRSSLRTEQSQIKRPSTNNIPTDETENNINLPNADEDIQKFSGKVIEAKLHNDAPNFFND
ncbi:hypothetical protein HYV10_00900 [Candidatus Dependentiae bacterium]|nr:hypothetical protein [Candidatus Dependentiae bacterium]